METLGYRDICNRNAFGYSDPIYIESLSEFGTPEKLSESGGAYLKRMIGTPHLCDGMGAYPFLSCIEWRSFKADIDDLQGHLVSFCAVLDPFGDYDIDMLDSIFPDLVIPFKEHYVIDFERPLHICPHHRRYAKKALRHVSVEITDAPTVWLKDWIEIYSHLVNKYKIGDLRAFSTPAFTRQFKIPGIKAFRAVYDGATVAMLLFLQQNDVVYYHLGSSNSLGYQLNASFALFSAAIEFFRCENVRFLNLGAGAGMVNITDDGLSRFKRGWANDRRTAYFCGRILNHAAYAELVRTTGNIGTSYFPAYRKGEFCKTKKPSTPTELQAA